MSRASQSSAPGNSAAGGYVVDERRFRCCFGCCHVEQGAVAIGMFGAVSCSLMIILLLLAGMHIIYMGSFAVALLINVLVIVAQQQRKASLYMPFLVTNIIGMIFFAIMIVASVYHLITLPSDSSLQSQRDHQHDMTRSMLSQQFGGAKVEINYGLFDQMARDVKSTAKWGHLYVIAQCLSGIAFGLWYEWVVYRAYVYMKMRKRAADSRGVPEHPLIGVGTSRHAAGPNFHQQTPLVIYQPIHGYANYRRQSITKT